MTGESALQPIASQQVVCVLGMHRSGTSLAARLANILGVALGSESEIVQAAPDNPRGFWEHPSFRRLNEALLARLGLAWDSVDELPCGWQDDPALDDLRAQATEAIASFAQEPIWGWKDPRTCLTLPFWQRLLPSMRYVLCVRSVMDVAQSLERRNGIPIETGARLWLHYTTAALERIAGHPTVFVFYEDVLADPHGQAARLSNFLSGDPERARSQADLIANAIDGDLRHHQNALLDMARDAQIHEAARFLYSILRASVPAPAGAGEAPSFFQTIAALTREAARRPDSTVMISELRAANQKQAHELGARSAQIDDLARQRHELRENVAALETDNADLTRRAHEFQQSIAALKAELRTLSNAYQEAGAANQALTTELQTIVSSRAWRWITEYRRVRRWIKRRPASPARRNTARSARSA